MPRLTRHIQPLDFTTPLDTATINLQAAATTEFSSGLIDMREFFIFTAVVNIVETTTTAGAFTLRWDVLEKDRSTVLWTVDLITAISPVTSGQEVLLFGAGASAALKSTSSGTIGADVDVFKQGEYANLVVEITTQADGDATAEVHLLKEG